MPKHPVSVTLDETNLVWLRGQAAATGRRSLSDVLDRLITDARTSGRVADGTIRSVAGTIDIDHADPMLTTADGEIRALFDSSLRPPFSVRERLPLETRQPRSKPAKRRRG